MYSRKGEGRSDSYVIYRSNLPPRYSGSRFTSDESFAENIVGECIDTPADKQQDTACICEQPSERRDIHKRKRRRLRGPRNAVCRKRKHGSQGGICGDKSDRQPPFPFSRLGHEELLLGMIILLLSREKHSSANGELMLILALLLALK